MSEHTSRARFTQAKLTEVPAHLSGVMRVADSRTSGILRLWLLSGNFDLNFLLRSIYLQGINDGFETIEREQEEGR